MAVLALVAIMAILPAFPPVAADGMPVVTTITIGDEPPEEVFGSIFENRQLAQVELVNDTHERIELFLSVYSLEPGRNLSIAVPLRTMPAYVHGAPMKESEFRESSRLDRTESEIARQDPDRAWGSVGASTRSALQLGFGSLACSLPGEVMRERAHISVEGSPDFYIWGGYISTGEAGYEPPVVAHYEFDGFSIDVLQVGAGPTLADYLAKDGHITTKDMPVGSYVGQYVAIIDSVMRPPIDKEKFDALTINAPTLIDYLINYTREHPTLDGSGIADLKERVWSHYLRYDSGTDTQSAYQLIDAIYADLDFSGEVLTIDLPLDSGKVFFPLGTSEGWPNKVGDIAVLFKVPEGKGLSISGTRDAYFGGSHWYLFEMKDANPGFDLDSTVTRADSQQRDIKTRAAFISDNAGMLGALMVCTVIIVVWLVASLLVDCAMGRKGKVIKDPITWLMLGAALVLSVPGALLVYLLARPVPLAELRGHRVLVSAMAVFPVAIALLAIGVAA